VRPAPLKPTSQSNGLPCSLENAFQRISSFEKNPENGKMPAIANVEMTNVMCVTGIHFLRPPILRMSCSPPIAWMTLPEPRNKQALKKAWVIKWKMPAAYAPTPMPMNMYPSWLTVEYARTRLMSFCATPMVAANKAVSAPIHATTCSVSGARLNRKFVRPIM